MPETVLKMTARIKKYNATAVPALCPPNDPASNPINRTGVEQGSWGAWRKDEL